MVCPKCKKENNLASKFCSHCGASLKKKVKKSKKGLIPQKITKIKLSRQSIVAMITVAALIFLGFLGFFLKDSIDFSFLDRGTNYTKNPSSKELPSESVVKVIVNKDTDEEASGSGLLFTEEGHILTNAHVVSSILGKPLKDITICYLDDNGQNVNCDYKANVIDTNVKNDLAVIQVEGGIKEIKPYLLVVEEDEESRSREIIDMGSEITAVGYPGVGDTTITLTKGIVSGYKNDTIVFYDGSMNKVPTHIKTDTEINYGNSGGAVFDENNRFVGIPSYLRKDDGGKIGYVIFWQKINRYLVNLIYKEDLTLNEKQYIEMKVPDSEKLFWEGVKAQIREDYNLAKDRLLEYTETNPDDTKGWNILCSLYIDMEDYEDLGLCAEELRSINDEKSKAISWYYSAAYQQLKENPDIDESYEFLNKGLDLYPDSVYGLNLKALIAIFLDKKEDAKKAIEDAKDIDELDPDIWYTNGVYEEFFGDYEKAIAYYEYSFQLSPDVGTASRLIEGYEYYENYDKVFEYSIAALILGSNDPGHLFNLLSEAMDLFFSEEHETFSDALSNIREKFEYLKVDKDLIKPVENISDEELVQFIKEVREIDEVSDELKNNYRFLVNMFTNWMYVFVDDKDMCRNFTLGKNGEEVIDVFESLDLDTENAVSLLEIHVYMTCFCNLDDYSEDKIISCYTEESDKLCEGNKIMATNGECMTPQEFCSEKYGSNVYAGDDGSCYCDDGYGWDNTYSYCVSLCPANSYYSGGSCYCYSGYQWYGDSCVTNEYYCDVNHGLNSFWSSYLNDCACTTGNWEYNDWWDGLYCSW